MRKGVIDKSVKKGLVSITRWVFNEGVSYNLSIGYRKKGFWINKEINIRYNEVPDVMSALKEIYEL